MTVSRRNIVKGTAWAVPAIVSSQTIPVFAYSEDPDAPCLGLDQTYAWCYNSYSEGECAYFDVKIFTSDQTPICDKFHISFRVLVNGESLPFEATYGDSEGEIEDNPSLCLDYCLGQDYEVHNAENAIYTRISICGVSPSSEVTLEYETETNSQSETVYV